ncbi:MAG: hypothetical protein ACLRPS_13925 [Paraprevotella clara]
MLLENSTQTVARRSSNAPFLSYLGRKGTQIRNAFLRGRTPRMLTGSVSPCAGRGLSYGIMEAGMRDRLAFCTFPDARESRICGGSGEKGANERTARGWDCHIDTWNIDRCHSGLGMSSAGVLTAFVGLV